MKDKIRFAIIGGSGLYNIEGVEILEKLEFDTPYGRPSTPVYTVGTKEGDRAYFIARHGANHEFSPSEVNYRANIFVLKKLGVEILLSVSAVGSLKEELPPKTLFLPDQFIDWTKGLRKRTFFEDGVVGHVSCADPISNELKDIIYTLAVKQKISIQKNGSYICIEGPQFSTRAESQLYRSFGASVIGMTNVPEAFLAKEAALAYSTLALVTDFDCWKEENVNVEEVVTTMKYNQVQASILIKELISYFSHHELKYEKFNKNVIMTKNVKLNETMKVILK
ncbi:MAG: S-methyl-5'-thioadenosine phosphorylase [Halobacteriovoraceae bacterium]|nr:S-methyl-5'-thioadenosine phosphorylase [Halobacteriovoraceae bacterium]